MKFKILHSKTEAKQTDNWSIMKIWWVPLMIATLNAFSNIAFKVLFVILVFQLSQKCGESSPGMLYGCSSALSSFLLSFYSYFLFDVSRLCFQNTSYPKILQVQSTLEAATYPSKVAKTGVLQGDAARANVSPAKYACTPDKSKWWQCSTGKLTSVINHFMKIAERNIKMYITWRKISCCWTGIKVVEKWRKLNLYYLQYWPRGTSEFKKLHPFCHLLFIEFSTQEEF